MKKASIVVILIVFAFILCACGKSKQAQEADDLILAIGEVSLDSAAAIETAENAVSGLSDRQRNQLENREILESARSTFSNLQYVQSHPFEYPLPLDFSWEMSLADAEKTVLICHQQSLSQIVRGSPPTELHSISARMRLR